MTLEKIDMVIDRVGCTYKEAKLALEKTDGNVVEAIIFLEDMYEEKDEEMENNFYETEEENFSFNDAIKALKEIIKKANASRIIFYKNEKTILDIPLTVGALGVVFFLPATLVSVIACLASGCSMKIFKENGDVIDIKEFSKNSVDDIKESFKKGDYKDLDDNDKDK